MIFILGLRGTGTSCIFKMVNSHPDIQPKLKFEPHELSFALDVSHIGRYKGNPFVKDTLDCWHAGIYGGAKIAYNPGQVSLRWKWIHEIFPDSKFIFVTRDAECGYKSLVSKDEDALYGVPTFEQYESYRKTLNVSFLTHRLGHSGTSVMMNYDLMLEFKDIDPVWNMLGVKSIDIKNMIREPRNVK